MPDVKIKGYSGAELEYQNVPKVWLAAPESTEDNPVLVPFTYGEALDNVEIVPDFSQGDMTVEADEGFLVRSAVVKMPEALLPENVAAGVDIAGIIGTLTAGKDVRIAMGLGGADTSDTVATTVTIEHGLGSVPDLIFVYNGTMGTRAGIGTYVLRSALGFSTAFQSMFGSTNAQYNVAYVANSSSSFGTTARNSTFPIEHNVSSAYNIAIHNTNEETFQMGNEQHVISGNNYRWLAIAGLA